MGGSERGFGYWMPCVSPLSFDLVFRETLSCGKCRHTKLLRQTKYDLLSSCSFETLLSKSKNKSNASSFSLGYIPKKVVIYKSEPLD